MSRNWLNFVGSINNKYLLVTEFLPTEPKPSQMIYRLLSSRSRVSLKSMNPETNVAFYLFLVVNDSADKLRVVEGPRHQAFCWVEACQESSYYVLLLIH